jgi:hypothetical protein
MSASKGERILRYQNLYRQYTRLGLSQVHDRPYAIAGLQTRLLRAFGTAGGVGVFDEGPALRGHLRRSLLWRRGDGVATLTPIEFQAGDDGDRRPPSWSWMAYDGGIDYLAPEFNKTRWEALESPWEGSGSGDGGGVLALRGLARGFDMKKSSGDEASESRIYYDRPEEEGSLGQKCVVLGVSYDGEGFNGARYVLVVKPAGKSTMAWVRVGAGCIPGACLLDDQSPVLIR